MYFPGVPIFKSKDLVNWTQIGHILDRPSQLKVDSLGISRGIFAPAISYHDSTFYMITTRRRCGGNFVVTAKNPAGPWSEPMWLKFDGIDPSLFFDDDGRSYIVNNGPPDEKPRYNGHRAIWLQQWDRATNAMVGPRKVIVNGGVDLSKNPIWIEAPHIFKVKDTYYLICAEGGTADQHSEVVFRSKSVFGPYEPFKGNPILTQRQFERIASIPDHDHRARRLRPNAERRMVGRVPRRAPVHATTPTTPAARRSCFRCTGATAGRSFSRATRRCRGSRSDRTYLARPRRIRRCRATSSTATISTARRCAISGT